MPTTTLPPSEIMPFSLIRYWRTSLADTALGKGRLGSSDCDKLLEINGGALREGALEENIIAKVFKNQGPKVQEMEVNIWPLIFAFQKKHGTATSGKLPEYVAPIVSAATINREGQIRPSKAVIARDLLTPLSNDAFEIGDIKQLDDFLTTSPLALPPEESDHAQIWDNYKNYCKDLLSKVTDNWPDRTVDYLRCEHGLLEVVKNNAMSHHIIKLYDNILENSPVTPL